MKKLLLAAIAFLIPLSVISSTLYAQKVSAQEIGANAIKPTVHFFGRAECTFCQAEKEFLKTLEAEGVAFDLDYQDIVENPAAKELFVRATEAAKLPKVTPLTIVGDRAVQGFQSPDTTGKTIRELLARAAATPQPGLEAAISAGLKTEGDAGFGCDATEVCAVTNSLYSFTLPFFGTVDLSDAPLYGLSAILGLVDGFNPCAMWVLVTFLLVLSQIGDKKRMMQIAGLFILAEATMYNLILNVWYSAWDFVGLDAIVTPAVGILALGSGVFFLYRWWKQRKETELVCDVTDLKQRQSISQRLKALAGQPLTWLTAAGIVGLAFSVNVIEFACSIGIPQAYSKILEINDLSFFARQWQMFIYTVGYMVDDFIVFGLALYGFDYMSKNGAKYSRWSTLIAAVLMLLLGALLVFYPEALVFG